MMFPILLVLVVMVLWPLLQVAVSLLRFMAFGFGLIFLCAWMTMP